MVRRLIWVLLLLIFTVVLSGRNVVKLSEPLGPAGLNINDNIIYIQDGEAILMYDLNDFRLLKKIGRKGSGPGEFKLVPYVRRLFLFFHNDRLIVCHLGRVSFFNKLTGDYIGEIKHHVMAGWASFHPIKDKYIALDVDYESKEPSRSIGLYDGGLKLEKVLFKVYNKEKDLKKIGALKPLKYGTSEKWVFIVPSDDFFIDVYDETGKKCHWIRKTVNKIPVSEEDKKNYAERYTGAPGDRGIGAMMIKRLIFPEKFPDIRRLYLSDGKIYVLTYERKGINHRCFVFTQTGKLLAESWVPFYNKNPMAEMNLLAIEKGKVFQLVENEDLETWELRIDEIQ